MLLGLYLQERLADPSDFTVRVPLAHLVDEEGRLVWARVELLVDELLAARPHLGTPTEPLTRRRPASALQWLGTET